MKISLPTVIGGVLLLVTALFIPVVRIYLNIPAYGIEETVYVTIITISINPTLGASHPPFWYMMPEVAIVLGGIFGVFGGWYQKKGLKIAAGVFGLASFAGAGIILFLTLLHPNISMPFTFIGWYSYGAYTLVIGAISCLIGLDRKSVV
jgi:hypothetical protein